jgi:hypothetical protein
MKKILKIQMKWLIEFERDKTFSNIFVSFREEDLGGISFQGVGK